MRQKMMIILAWEKLVRDPQLGGLEKSGKQQKAAGRLAAHTSSMHHEARFVVYLVKEVTLSVLT